MIAEANFQALFPRVAAVVHHGGAGTTTLAALAGAQAIVPQVYDQHYFARRIHELGVALAHAPGTPSSESLTDAPDCALRTEVGTRAKSVATRVRRDGTKVAVKRLASARV